MLVRLRDEVQEVPRELGALRTRASATLALPSQSVRSGRAVRRRPGVGHTDVSGNAPRPTWGKRLRDLLLVFVAFALGACTLTAYTTFRIWQVGQQDGRRQVDAIVVLGAAQLNGRPSDVLAARMDHAIELYKEGYAPYLITTGSNKPGDWTTEAEVGRKYALAHGVPASAILIDNTSDKTLQQMQHVKALFDARGLHTALFVSDRSHMLRVLRMAQDQGIEAWASPTDTSPDDIDGTLIRNSMLHELGGLAFYIFVDGDPDPGADSSAAPATSPAASPPRQSPTAR